MIRASEARREAREALNGKWKKAFLISLAYAAFTFAVGFVISFIGSFVGILGVILAIGEIVIAPPLTYGIAYSFYHLKNGEDVSYGDFLKAGFSNFGRSWGVAWRIFCKCWYLIVIPLVILFIILGIGISLIATSNVLSSELRQEDYLKTSYSATPYTSYYDYLDDYDYGYDYYDNYDDYSDYYDDYSDYYDNYYNNYDNNYNYNYSDDVSSAFMAALVGASVGAIVVAIFVLIIYIVIVALIIRKLLLYALSYYIAVAKENIEPRDAVQESENLMRGNRGRLFCLMLSFIGWAFLIGIVEGIVALIPAIGFILGPIAGIVGMALLTPYTTFAILAFYQDLINGNNPNAYVNVGGNQVGPNGPVVGGYNNVGMNGNPNNYNSGVNNGYQVNNNQGMNNGYQVNNNQGMNNGYQVNNNQGMNNGYQVNTNPEMNNQVNNTEVKAENSIQNSEEPKEKKYCNRCGAENTGDATYCTNCGAKLD